MEPVEKKKRQCKNCGTSIYGRADKKFCNDVCRNAFHNQKSYIIYAGINKINSILRQNRTILKKLYSYENERINIQILKSHGFQFNYFTEIGTDQNGDSVFYCYEYGYKKINKRWLSLYFKKGERII